MRKPRLDCAVVDSLDTLLQKLPAGNVIGTPEEAGVRYLSDLIKHYRSPEAAAQRRRDVARVQRNKQHRVGA